MCATARIHALACAAVTACLAMAMRNTFSNYGDGFDASGGFAALTKFRPT